MSVWPATARPPSSNASSRATRVGGGASGGERPVAVVVALVGSPEADPDPGALDVGVRALGQKVQKALRITTVFYNPTDLYDSPDAGSLSALADGGAIVGGRTGWDLTRTDGGSSSASTFATS